MLVLIRRSFSNILPQRSVQNHENQREQDAQEKHDDRGQLVDEEVAEAEAGRENDERVLPLEVLDLDLLLLEEDEESKGQSLKIKSPLLFRF